MDQEERINEIATEMFQVIQKLNPKIADAVIAMMTIIASSFKQTDKTHENFCHSLDMAKIQFKSMWE